MTSGATPNTEASVPAIRRPEGLKVTYRRMKFPFEDAGFDRYWFGSPFVSLFWSQLSTAFEPGEKFFINICRALGVDWDKDERFHDIESRLANEDELDRVMAEGTRRFTRAELVDKLIAADVLTAPINEVEDVIKDPQILHNKMIVSTEHPVLGRLDVTGVPIHFHGTPCSVKKHPPMQGEHTRELLTELGYSAADIDALIARGLAADHAELQRLREARRAKKKQLG